MIKVGVDYYPEHWDERIWEQDADLMAQVGVKIVRLAEFSWSKLEPKEGCFDFSWLDRAIDIFTQRNIEIILCTPTNCPPRWMYQQYEETIQTGRDGRKLSLGIRGHRCYTSPIFRKYASRIINELTCRYSKNKNVIAWQIDNELEANVCCCEHCTQAYHIWLKNKYDTLEKLNQAYGNNVWSGEYSSWEQLKPPMGTYPDAWLNPAYILDYYRFASDSTVDYVAFQSEIIRRNHPDVIVTTNICFCDKLPNFHNLFNELDVVSYDNYPTTSIPTNREEIYSNAYHLDMMRGIKNKNFWIMEQLSGTPGCWMPMKSTTQPGMLKGYSLQTIAHGADVVIHFRWRTAVTGAEMFWHGLIDHSNVPGRRFKEFADLCAEVNQLPEMAGSIIENKCAILYGADQDYALKAQPQTDGFNYYNQIKSFHHAFMSLGVGVDIISQYEDFSSYQIIIAPTLYVTDEQVVNKLYRFTRDGGTVILTNRSGVKDMNNNCIMDELPTAFKQLIGARVKEYDPIGHEQISVSIEGKAYEITQWCDILEVDTAEVVAIYSDKFYAGKPAITKNEYGLGKAYYVGTIGRKDFYRHLAEAALKDAGLNYIECLPDGITLTIRKKESKEYYFLFNNTQQQHDVKLMEKEIALDPFEMKIWQN